MGEISDLRVRILCKSLIPHSRSNTDDVADTVKTLDPEYQTDSRFVLSHDIDRERWTIILVRPLQHKTYLRYSKIFGKGVGETPKAAHEDLLKITAIDLRVRGFE